MKKLTVIILLFLLSCTDKKLDERKFRMGDLVISRYQISFITSVHEYVEVTKNDKSEQLLKANTRDIDTIFLIRDTLVIRTRKEPVIYEKKDKVFNYFIKIDSSSVGH